ncbi:unnamed protein product [Ilex paraguariensis]|uniref:Uncharacterized protein n=1 Tax=Ilex paraguariensis TaxID=185542 RepID=A0ABC8UXP1_9AQUA
MLSLDSPVTLTFDSKPSPMALLTITRVIVNNAIGDGFESKVKVTGESRLNIVVVDDEIVAKIGGPLDGSLRVSQLGVCHTLDVLRSNSSKDVFWFDEAQFDDVRLTECLLNLKAFDGLDASEEHLSIHVFQ